jgi:branched-chain amino acid transport system substrate-binding protein
MKTGVRWLVLMAVLVVVPWPVAAQDEIKIGAFAPLSGLSADVGAQMKAGIEVAVERVNAQGVQLRGKPGRVRVIWYDDEGKGDVGLNVVTRALTVDRIHVGIRFLSSDVFIRVMEIDSRPMSLHGGASGGRSRRSGSSAI